MNVVTLVSPTLRIRVSRGDLTVVRLEGELDMACTDLVAAAARLVPDDATLITADLRDLTFVDLAGVDASAALHVLRGMFMADASPQVERVFGFLGMGTWLSQSPSARRRRDDLPPPHARGSALGHPAARRPVVCGSAPLHIPRSVSS